MRLRFLLPLLIPALVSGCINYEQQTTLDADGSGSMTIHYWTKESVVQWLSGERFTFTEDDARSRYAALPGVQVKDVRVEQQADDSTRHVYLSLEFDDIRALSRQPGFDNIEFTLVEQNGTLRFLQRIIAEDDANGLGLEQFTIRYTWEFPGEPLTHNATSADGSTLTWAYTLDQLAKTRELQAELSVTGGGLPLSLLLPVVIALVLGSAVLVVLRRRRNTGSAPPAA